MLRLAIAWPAVSLGIAMLLQARLGVAPFDVLNTGVARVVGASFAIVYLGVSLLFYAIGMLLGGRAGWASVVGTFVIGPLIGVFRSALPEPGTIIARSVMMVAASLILATAVCLVITTELGAGPTEVLMLGLIRRNVPIVAARWITDGVPLVIGALIGGAVGIATVIFAFALGPLIKFGLSVLRYTPPHDTNPLALAAID